MPAAYPTAIAEVCGQALRSGNTTVLKRRFSALEIVGNVKGQTLG
jgi:hypothetical protein